MDELKILIQAELNKQISTRNINKDLKKISKEISKLNIGINIDSESLKKHANNFQRTFHKAADDVSSYTKGQLRNAFKGDEYKNVRKKLQSVLKDVEDKNGNIGNILIQQNKKTGAITSATIKYADNLGKVRSELYQIERKWDQIIDKNGKAQKRLRVNLVNTKSSVNNNVGAQQTKNYREAKQELKIIEDLKLKLLKVENKESDLAKIYQQHISRHEETLKEIQQRKIRISETEQTDALNLRQINDLERERLRLTERRNEEAIRQRHNASNNPSSRAVGEVIDIGERANFNGSPEDLQRYANAIAGADAEITRVVPRVDRLGNQIREMNIRVREGGRFWRNYTASLDETTGTLRRVDRGLTDVQNRQLGVNEQFRIAISRTAIWAGAMTAFYGSARILQNILETVTEIDTQMTHLKRVMDQGTNFNSLLQGSIDLANELGKKVTDINESMIGLAQAGYKANELLDITKTTVIASNVSDLSPEEAMNNLISAMVQFNIEARNSISIIDKMNEVDNTFSITTRNLSDSVSKAGAVASTYGVTLDQLIGYTTAVGEATRESGRIIGTGLKSIFSRLYMEQSISALKEVGVAVRDVNGENRKASDIINDLGSKWSSLTSTQKQNLATTVAGLYQVSRFTALFNNFDTAIKATETSLNSQGSAVGENKRYLNSLQALINKLIAAWQELAIVIGDSGLKQAFATLLKGLTVLTNGFSDFTKATHGLNIYLPLLAAGIYGIVKAFKALRAASISAQLSLGWIGLLVVGVETIVSLFMGLNRETKINTKAIIENANQTKRQADEIQKLVDKYNTLKSQSDGNAKSQKELQSVLKQINKIAPQLIENTEDYGEALSLNESKVKSYTDRLKKMSEEQLRQANLANQININNTKEQINSISNSLEDQSGEIKNNFDKIISYQKEFNVATIKEAEKLRDELENKANSQLTLDQTLFRQVDKLNEYIKLMKSNELSNYTKNFEQRSRLQEQLDSYLKLSDVIKESIENVDNLKNKTDEMNESTEEQVDRTVVSTESIKALYEEASDLSSAYVALNEGQELSSETIFNLIDKYPDLLEYLVKSNDLTFKKGEILTQVANKERLTRLQETQNAIESVQEKKRELEQKGELYAQFYSRIFKFIGLSTDKITNNPLFGLNKEDKKKISEYDKYIKELQIKADLLRKPIELQDYDNSSSSSSSAKAPYIVDVYTNALDALDLQFQKLQQEQSNLTSTSDEYKQNLLSQIGILKQKQKLNHEHADALREENSQLASGTEQWDKNNQAIRDAQSSYISIRGNIDSINDSLGQFLQNQRKIAEESATTDYNNSLAILDLQLQKLQLHQSELSDTSEKYRNSLREQIDILLQRQEMAHGQADFYREQNAQIEDQLKNGNLTNEQIKALNDELEKNNQHIRETQSSWLNWESTIISTNKSIQDSIDRQQELQEENYKKWQEGLGQAADDAIDVIKEHYKQRQELATEAIETELDELEKLHKEKNEMLDEELSKYEEIINAQLRSIDRRSDAEDYTKSLTKAENERLALQNKISILSLNDSIEAKARKEELEKELAEKVKEIEELKSDRTKELRKQNLQDLQEQKQKEIDTIRETEQDSYEANKESLEQKKKDEQQYWEDKINNDKYFANLREQVLQGNVENLTSILETFALDVSDAMNSMGKIIDENLAKFDLKDLGNINLQNIKDDLTDAIGGLNETEKNKTPVDTSVEKEEQNQYNDAFQRYIQNKLEWYKIFEGSGESHDFNNRQKELAEENKKLREKFGFPDYTIEDIRRFNLASLDTGGKTPSWGNYGKLGILHEKELVLNKYDTPNLLKTISFTRQIVDKIKSFSLPNLVTNNNNNSDNSQYINIYIDKVLGDKKGAEMVSDTIIKRLSAKGVL